MNRPNETWLVAIRIITYEGAEPGREGRVDIIYLPRYRLRRFCFLDV